MILSRALLLLVASAFIADGEAKFFGVKTDWVETCKLGSKNKMKKIDCDQIGESGLKECIEGGVDENVALAIRKCKKNLPTEISEQDKMAINLAKTKPLSFAEFIGDKRCVNLSPEALRELLESTLESPKTEEDRRRQSHVIFSLAKNCTEIGEKTWGEYKEKAKSIGRDELVPIVSKELADRQSPTIPPGANNNLLIQTPIVENVSGTSNLAAMQKTDASTAGYSPVSGSSDPFPNTPVANLISGGAPSGEESGLPTARAEYDANLLRSNVMNGISGTASAPALPLGPYGGELLRITPEFVAAHPNILAQLTPCQARKFGLLSCGCMGLTDAHFKAPGVSSRVVARLPLNCFQKTPPGAFAGFNACMVARIRWWPFVTREQIAFVPVGDPIRALPFDMLGMGRQRGSDDKMHPCWSITRDQLGSIRKSVSARREYYRRCVKSSAEAIATLSPLIIAVLVSALAVVPW